MKLIKQLKFLTFQVILSLIILNTQISFAQDKKINLKSWEGSYAGLGYSDSKLVDDHIEVRTSTGEANGYTGNISSIKKIPSIFIGYNWVDEKKLLSGLEFSIEKRNFFKNDFQYLNGVVDTTYPTTLKSEGYGYSLKGRIGEVINDQTLIYVTGGIAIVPIERKFCSTSCSNPATTDTFKRNEKGLILGLGLEHKFQGDISLKFDYEHRQYETPDFVPVNAWHNLKEIHDTYENSFKVSLVKSF
jgi:opacity protein-like surface antigen